MSEIRNRAPGRTLGMGEVTAVRDRASIAAPFGQALVEIANADRRVVGLSADLAKYTDIQPFAEAFPGRFYQRRHVGAESHRRRCRSGKNRVDSVCDHLCRVCNPARI